MRVEKINRVLVAGLILITALGTYAQPDKDIIGTWKMDASRSSFSATRGAPQDVLIKFERDDGVLRETIKVTNTAGESTRIINYAFNGAETANGINDERIKTKLSHNEDALILEWMDEGGTFTRTLKLSNDRRLLSIKARDLSSEGKTEDLIVLQRQ